MANGHPEAGGSSGHTRRSWVDVLLGGSLVAWAGAVIYPVLRYLTPPKDSGGANTITLTDSQKQELTNVGSLITRIGTDRVIVLKKKDGNLAAFSAKCTHEGCTVQFVPADALIWCACHNGKFSLDGRVLSGPPPRPLAAFPVDGDLKGNVTISRSGGAA
ncbi:MAG TPA: Rieske 2Fe-2S domain-containing protein [Thermoanaerobaculia bacterium]|nr:Rieske 2Fe-2S domain-containing protein [Thermoanaerobaculia bacterium]